MSSGPEPPAPLTQAAAIELIRRSLVETLDVDPIVVVPDADLQGDLGLTSLDVIELLTVVEDALGVELGPHVVPDPRRIATVGALARLLCGVAGHHDGTPGGQ